MSFTSWLRNLSLARAPGRAERNRGRRQSDHGRAIARLVLEQLEDRCMPSCLVSLAPSEAAPQLVGERITWRSEERRVGKV